MLLLLSSFSSPREKCPSPSLFPTKAVSAEAKLAAKLSANSAATAN